MRLSNLECDLIRRRLLAVDPNGKIYLFGSRISDVSKGGDIDIYFETTKPLDMETQLKLEYQLGFLCNTKCRS